MLVLCKISKFGLGYFDKKQIDPSLDAYMKSCPMFFKYQSWKQYVVYISKKQKKQSKLSNQYRNFGIKFFFLP